VEEKKKAFFQVLRDWCQEALDFPWSILYQELEKPTFILLVHGEISSSMFDDLVLQLVKALPLEVCEEFNIVIERCGIVGA